MSTHNTHRVLNLDQDDLGPENPDEFRELSEDYSGQRANLTITSEDLAMLEAADYGTTRPEANDSAHTVHLHAAGPEKTVHHTAQTVAKSEEIDLEFSEADLASLEGCLEDPELKEKDSPAGIIRDELDKG